MLLTLDGGFGGIGVAHAPFKHTLVICTGVVPILVQIYDKVGLVWPIVICPKLRFGTQTSPLVCGGRGTGLAFTMLAGLAELSAK